MEAVTDRCTERRAIKQQEKDYLTGYIAACRACRRPSSWRDAEGKGITLRKLKDSYVCTDCLKLYNDFKQKGGVANDIPLTNVRRNDIGKTKETQKQEMYQEKPEIKMLKKLLTGKSF